MPSGDTPSDIVNARLINDADEFTQATTGRYGWWIGDESQKARILSDSYEGEGFQFVLSTREVFTIRAHPPVSPVKTGKTFLP